LNLLVSIIIVSHNKGRGMTHESQPVILVLDTNPETLFTLANELGSCGYRVLAAQDVDEAIAIGESNAFEILLYRQRSADLQASQLLRYFRRFRHLRQLRLIAISSTQIPGVRLHHRDGESVYSIRSSVSVNAIAGVIRQAMCILPPSYARSGVGVSVPPTHFRSETLAKR